MSRSLLHLCVALLLAGFSSSCLLAIGTEAKEHHAVELAAKARGENAGPAAAGAEGKEAAPESEAAKKKAARKAEKKAREASYARMELALAEMGAENDLRDAKFDLESARLEVEAAQRELDHFQKVERPIELEDSAIDVDRSVNSAMEQKQELDELAAMYKKDSYAELTKELVLNRGKFQLEMAQRSMELTKKRVADKKDHDLVKKERDLGRALAKAQEGLAAAEAKLRKTQSQNELELMRARHKLEDAERPDDDEESKGS